MMRLSPFGIISDHWHGLADHRNGSGGRPDWPTRVAVLLFPAAAGTWAAGENWSVQASAANLTAAGALLAALMVALFVQVAAWRTRLDDRAFTHMIDEAPTRRAVDGTAAHSLMGALVSVAATGLCVMGGVMGQNRAIAGVAVALGVYLVFVLLIIFHMAYVAYQSVSDPAVQENDDKLLARGTVTVQVPGRKVEQRPTGRV